MTNKKVCVILGASPNRKRYSNKAVRAYLQKGYKVIPVNNAVAEVEGIPTVKSLKEITGPVDLLCVYINQTTARKINLALQIATLSPPETLFPPDQDFDDIINILNGANFPAHQACSIIAAGYKPSSFSCATN